MVITEIVRYLLAVLSMYMLVTGTIPMSCLLRSRGYKIQGHPVRLASVFFLAALYLSLPVYIRVTILIMAHIALVKAAVNARKKFNSDNLG